MPKFTDIKRKIDELNPASFQEFCDALLSKKGYTFVHGYGMKAGTEKTTIGNPDTYFRNKNGNYTFVAYTNSKNNITSKIKEDIEKCLDQAKTKLNIEFIDEIIYCHTSSNISPGDDKMLHDLCEERGITLTIFGIDEIAAEVYKNFHLLAKDFLGISISTNQILSYDDFISQYDSNKMVAPLNTHFQFRKDEFNQLLNGLNGNNVVVVTGKAGVGKTRLVLEVIKKCSEENGYQLLCVKNRSLEIYDDLVSATTDRGKYLFFIDDANELPQLNLIAEYITKEELGYDIKIIVTFRDYVKDDVIDTIKKYDNPYTINIQVFTDDEIQEFLKLNLEIFNQNYLDQIIKIAEGNPRIAYMAGKIAVDKQSLSSINNAYELYDSYYKSYVKCTIGSNQKLCFVAGLLAILKKLRLDDCSSFQVLLDDYGITIDDFKNFIIELSDCEVVEIHYDLIVTISDECFFNYMLYYVFFEKKMIPFSRVLEIGFKNFHDSICRSISIILHIFHSTETLDYCSQEINTVWDNFETQKDSCFDEFAMYFHIFRPEQAFLLAKSKIDKIETENFNPFDVNLSKNEFDENESVLNYLTGYQLSDKIEYVMGLLFLYASKNKISLMTSSHWLTKNYGIDKNSSNHDYDTQIRITDQIRTNILQNNNIAEVIGFEWCKYSLNFTFEPLEIGRNNKMIIYHVEIKKSDEILEYRKKCWEILMQLSYNPIWQDKIIDFLDTYGRNCVEGLDKDIINRDLIYIERLLKTIKCDEVDFFEIVNLLYCRLNKAGIQLNKKWLDVLSNEKWKLYHILNYNFWESDLEYDNFVEERNKSLGNFAKELLITDMSDLVKIINEFLDYQSSKNRLSHEINGALEIILRNLNTECLSVFLESFIKYGTHISIAPYIVLEPLLKEADDPSIILSLLKEHNFAQKNEWMFCFFEELPKEKVNNNMLNELIAFFEDDSDKDIKSVRVRRVKFLDNFKHLKSNIYPSVYSIILKKAAYNSFIVQVYLEDLFNSNEYTFDELTSMFNGDINLLQDMYCFLLKRDCYFDSDGTYLLSFLSKDECFIKKYSEILWKNYEERNDHIFSLCNVLWTSENYIVYFECIFKNRSYCLYNGWSIESFYERILLSTNDEIIKCKQMHWIEYMINKNAKNDEIIDLFYAIAVCRDEVRRKALKLFLQRNQDIEMFKKLSLFRNSLSVTGSFVPALERRIKFLESLYPLVSGMNYLEHKVFIQNQIESLNKEIKSEKVNELLKDKLI